MFEDLGGRNPNGMCVFVFVNGKIRIFKNPWGKRGGTLGSKEIAKCTHLS